VKTTEKKKAYYRGREQNKEHTFNRPSVHNSAQVPPPKNNTQLPANIIDVAAISSAIFHHLIVNTATSASSIGRGVGRRILGFVGISNTEGRQGAIFLQDTA